MKRSVFLFLFLTLVFELQITAQMPIFNNTYDDNNTTEAYGSIGYFDGTFYLTGRSFDSLSYVYYQQRSLIGLMKVAADGTLLTAKKYGDRYYSYSSQGSNIIQINNSFYFVGTTVDTSETYHGFLFKFNSNLDSLLLIVSNNSNDTVLYNDDIEDNKNIVLTGFIDSSRVKREALLIKMDTLGNILLEKKYISSGMLTAGWNIDVTQDNGYIIGGHRRTTAYASQDPIVIKVDSAGNKEWEHVFVNSINDDWPAVVRAGNDSTIYVVTSEFVGGTDTYPWARIFLHQFDLNGNLLWRKPVADTMLLAPCTDLKQLSCGDLILIRGGSSPGYHIIRTDANGNVLKTNKHYLYHRKLYDCTIATIYPINLVTLDTNYFAIAGFTVPSSPSYNNTQEAWLTTFDTTACQLPLKPYNLQATITYQQATDTMYTGARQDTIISLTWQYDGDMTNKVFMVEQFIFDDHLGFLPASYRCRLASSGKLPKGYTDTTFFQDTVPIYEYDTYLNYLFSANTFEDTHPNGVLYYRVRVVDTLTRLEGCASPPIAVDITVGIPQISTSAAAVGVFPNPNTGSFTVWHNYPPHTSLQLTLYDMQGQVVKTQNITQNRQTVVFSQPTPNGVYFYQITSPQHPPVSGKLILNR